MTKIDILKDCIVDGNVVKLPPIQLDRKLYQDVAKSIELIGGKWKGGKTMGFVFNADPSDLLYEIANGEKRNLKKEYQFFATPDKLAAKLVMMADLKSDDVILEPSAGQGAIIKAINNVTDSIPDCYELMDVNVAILKKSGLKFNLIGDDFLSHDKKLYTKIIANPPFSKHQDITHVMNMYRWLKVGGTLVTIMSESCMTREQKVYIDFRNFLDNNNAEIHNIDRGEFKESGTMVGGIIVVITKS
jgi:hypothetical protein